MTPLPFSSLTPLPLPPGVTSRFVNTHPVSLNFHMLESMPSACSSQPPLIVLLHGYPNVAHDWRFMMPALADAGYYVVAYDMRGFGRTHDPTLKPLNQKSFTPLTMVRDLVTLVSALGYSTIHTLVGQDLGSFAASICTLARSDMIKSLVLMAHPFRGPPKVPFATDASSQLPSINSPPPNRFDDLRDPDIQLSLLKLDPPRKHYKWYNTSPDAAAEWTFPKGEQLKEFLRGYFHLKSADYAKNKPGPLGAWQADRLAVMPYYYIMRADLNMRENVALLMSEESDEVRRNLRNTPWLPDPALDIYVAEWERTGFADALTWYKVQTDPSIAAELQILAGKKITVPTKHVSGDKDWGTYQDPGAIEAMEEGDSVERGMYKGTIFLQGVGHWVNVERPEECVREVLDVASCVAS